MTVFMAVCEMITPLLMLILGIYFYKNPPKEVNSFSGYRTTYSMKNRETWRYANQLCGKMFAYIGGVTTAVTALIEIVLIKKGMMDNFTADMIIIGVQIVVLILPIIPVEIALRKTFDENGKKK